MPSTLKPRHPHNCDKCTFLGAHVSGKRWHDLYHCSTGAVVARYGPDDQFTGLDLDNTGRRSIGTPAINSAIDLAKERGLAQ